MRERNPKENRFFPQKRVVVKGKRRYSDEGTWDRKRSPEGRKTRGESKLLRQVLGVTGKATRKL